MASIQRNILRSNEDFQRLKVSIVALTQLQFDRMSRSETDVNCLVFWFNRNFSGKLFNR